MKANYYISFVTDLVRTNEPIIKDVCKDLCSDFEDFVFTAYLRFMGIKRKYPTAIFERTERGARVIVDGVLVYELELLHIDPEPVEIPDEE
jgi:hypothetical protein